jgi:hypothetical protein
MPGEERRRWRRLRTELRLQLEIADGDGVSQRVVTAFGSHLNPAGIFVQMSDPPSLGARVRVTLALEGTNGLLSAEGVVVDRVVLDNESDRPPGIGLRLDETGPAWKKLYDWLSDDSQLDS